MPTVLSVPLLEIVLFDIKLLRFSINIPIDVLRDSLLILLPVSIVNSVYTNSVTIRIISLGHIIADIASYDIVTGIC